MVKIIPSFPASCRSFILEERSPGYTSFHNQEQVTANIPLQMAGQEARLSLATSLGVLDEAQAVWAASGTFLIPSSIVPSCDLRFTLR